MASRFVSLVRLCIVLGLLAPALAYAQLTGVLEIPGNGVTLSGIGVISGWKCEAEGDITISLNAGESIPATYGLPRADTSGVCENDGNNGFFSYTNWGNLGDGEHTAVVYDKGVEFGRSTFTVATLGEAFVRGASGECTITDFPAPGEAATFAWNQATQHLELVSEPPSLEFPLRALHVGSNAGINHQVVGEWEAAGRTGPLIPLEYIAWLQSLHVNWVGLSVALHYDDSMDSTVERVYSDVELPTFSDAALRQLIREFQSHGFHVYLTLAFEAAKARTSARPVQRIELGATGDPQTGVPRGSQGILPEFWPWWPDHPDHQRFVAEFWETYTQQAVYFARMAEEEGVRLYSLGTETPSLFRTRSSEFFTNHFRLQLTAMVARVRDVYRRLLTYDMHFSAFTAADFYGPNFKYLWDDLDLDIVGISAYFPLTDSRPTTVLSVGRFQASYEQIFQDYLIPVAEHNPERPILFLEYSILDTLEASTDPGVFEGVFEAGFGDPFVFSDADGNGLDDGREIQANVFQALFNTIAQHPGVLNGVFLGGEWITTEELWEGFWAHTRGEFLRNNELAAEVVRRTYEGYKQR